MQQNFPLIGLSSERHRLAEALRKRQVLLVLGPAGSGKSALICSAIADLPSGQRIIHLRYSASLHHLLIDLARSLFETGHRGLRRLARPAGDLDKWLSQQTSLHLKGLLWTSLETEPRTIVLDGIDGASFPMYRFLQRLYYAKGMGLVAAARDPFALGTLARLFWDPRAIVHIQPLNDTDAQSLFGLAVDRFRLSHLDLEEFRDKVLKSAQGNPGQIIEMCRMAANPMYLIGRHIKFAPLRIDVLTKFLG